MSSFCASGLLCSATRCSIEYGRRSTKLSPESYIRNAHCSDVSAASNWKAHPDHLLACTSRGSVQGCAEVCSARPGQVLTHK